MLNINETELTKIFGALSNAQYLANYWLERNQVKMSVSDIVEFNNKLQLACATCRKAVKELSYLQEEE